MPLALVSLARVVPEVLVHVRLQPFSACLFWPGPRLAPSSSGSWPCSSPRWPPWRPWSRIACRPSWRRPRRASRRFPVSSGSLRPRSCAPAPDRGRLFRRLLPNRSRGSFLLSQRGATGLAVKSCPAAPPERSASSHRRSSSSASAGPVEPAGASSGFRAPTPSERRVPAADPSASAALPASGGRA